VTSVWNPLLLLSRHILLISLFSLVCGSTAALTQAALSDINNLTIGIVSSPASTPSPHPPSLPPLTTQSSADVSPADGGI
jgi:hypothetical protein